MTSFSIMVMMVMSDGEVTIHLGVPVPVLLRWCCCVAWSLSVVQGKGVLSVGLKGMGMLWVLAMLLINV